MCNRRAPAEITARRAATHTPGGVITWRLHSLVMVGVDTHFILLQVEGVLAGVDGFQLVVAVEVWPPPQAAVKDVGQTFTVGHLQTPIQGPEQRANQVKTPAKLHG